LTRIPAPSIGNSGLTVLVVLIAGLIAQLATRSTGTGTLIGAGVAGVLVVGSSLVFILTPSNDAEPFSVAIVQGSTPCPFEHCSPNERLRTYEQHLALTETIPSGRVDLVVWSEGSTGSVNADPVQNPAIGAAIGAEARRIGGWMLVGSDRPVSSEEWYNANVLFNPAGEIVGEYRKQHAVPFGEYIPLRPVFDWIPELAAVPRDMIPGDGPVVFDLEDFQMGSVISFEGVFSRYARGHTRSGAEVMVVATNEGSYGETAASDQLIGMTRMRAAELGVFVIHAAVTGKSVVIDSSGKYASEVSDLAEQIVVYGDVVPTRAESPYSRFGNVVITVAAVAGILMWWRSRSLVGSSDGVFEKE
jgi:apolipoprotein N-acyltransferase